MTQVASPCLYGAWYPGTLCGMSYDEMPTLVATSVANATNGKLLFAGRVLWADGGTHTISSSGGVISALTATVTWATSGTTVRVGLQDPNPSLVRWQPTGTFDVYADWVQGTDALASNTWTNFPMASGSKTLANSDPVCIVWDMTTRNGSDSLTLTRTDDGPGRGFQGSCVTSYTSSWLTPTVGTPNVLLTADDGTLGVLAGGVALASNTAWQYKAGDAPDEIGILIDVPWHCKANAAMVRYGSSVGVNADCTLNLYADPLGSPSTLYSHALEGAYRSSSINETSELILPFTAPVTLTPGQYGLTLLATGSSNIRVSTGSAPSSTVLPVSGLTPMIARASGVFGASSTAGIMGWALALSSIDSGHPRPALQIGI